MRRYIHRRAFDDLPPRLGRVTIPKPAEQPPQELDEPLVVPANCLLIALDLDHMNGELE